MAVYMVGHTCSGHRASYLVNILAQATAIVYCFVRAPSVRRRSAPGRWKAPTGFAPLPFITSGAIPPRELQMDGETIASMVLARRSSRHAPC
jgi:hypothetical protein